MSDKQNKLFDLAVKEWLRSVRPTTERIVKVNACKAIEVDEDERTIVQVVSDESVDRDNEVVMTGGLDLSNFKRNPVVLFMHDPTKVVGKSLWQKKQKRDVEFVPPAALRDRVRQNSGKMTINAMLAKTKFADTELGNEVYALTKGDFLRGASIGMAPFTMIRREATMNERKKRPDIECMKAIVIEKAEVLEYSQVSIPANPNALIEAEEKGMMRQTLPLYEPLLREVVDAAPRKRAKVIPVAPRVREVQPRIKDVTVADPAIVEAHVLGRI